jgi:zinc protease
MGRTDLTTTGPRPGRRGLRALLLAVTLSAPGLPGAAAAPAAPTEAVVLPNGLTLFVKPIKDAKEVALVVVFRVGGDHDPAGKSGLAHLVEHCYATAAAGDCPARAHDELLTRYPTGHNAQTADRHTIVAQVFSPEKLEDELRDAANRMGALKITAEDLAREKPRVLIEVGNMFEKKPDLAAVNRARERVLPNRAGGRRAGLPAHVEALTLEDVQQFAEKHYKAGNAVMALAGAVDVDKARLSVRTAFAEVPKGVPPPEPPAAPVEPPGGRLDEVEVAASIFGGTSTACVAYAAPPPSSPDYVPFLVVAARLIKSPQSHASSAPTVKFAPLDEPGALYVSMPLAADQKADAAVATLHAWVAEAVGRPFAPLDVPNTAAHFGLHLGTDTSKDFSLARYPYTMSLRLAAGNVLGVDGGAITKGLDRLRGPDLAAAAVRIFDPLKAGAAVVRVKR